MSSIVVDWGSSSFRAYLLNDQLQCIDSVKNQSGVLNIKIPYQQVFTSACGEWIKQYSVKRILCAGSVGSREGWLETPYAKVPFSMHDFTESIKYLELSSHYSLGILPGVQGISPSGQVDVMRGEEMHLFGILDQIKTEEALVCLPGTHSKWARVKNGQIDTFATFMTGEMFELLCANSYIGKLIKTRDFEQESFLQGVLDSKKAHNDGVSLLHSLFSVRAAIVSQTFTVPSLYSYISGFLITNEISNALEMFNGNNELFLVADSKLTAPYQLALESFSLQPTIINSEQAFLNGFMYLDNFINEKNAL